MCKSGLEKITRIELNIDANNVSRKIQLTGSFKSSIPLHRGSLNDPEGGCQPNFFSKTGWLEFGLQGHPPPLGRGGVRRGLEKFGWKISIDRKIPYFFTTHVVSYIFTIFCYKYFTLFWQTLTR